MSENNIAEKIKNLRKKRKMTLEEVGEIVGVTKSTVRKWETGYIANMKRDKIFLLAQALGTSPQYLMGWEEKDYTKKLPTSNEEFISMLRQYNKGKAQVFFCGDDGKVIELSPEETAIMKNLLKMRKDTK